MLRSTVILIPHQNDVVTEESWMGGDLIRSEVRFMSGFQTALDGDDWKVFLRSQMAEMNHETYDSVIRVIAINNGRSYLVEV